MKQCREVVVAAIGRSALAKARKGSFAGVHPVELGAKTLAGVLDRLPQLDLKQVDDFIVGCSTPCGEQGSNMAKLVLQRVGFPENVPAQTVNRFCSSGLQTIATASNAIAAGAADIIIAGGIESMTRVSMIPDPKDADPWLLEHFPDAYMPMGMTAENVADDYGVTRLEMDTFASRSHERAAKAQNAGEFKRQIVEIAVMDENGQEKVVKSDEGIRAGTTPEILSTLATPFKENGSVTAGTSSQMTDGAAFAVMMDAETAKRLNVKPLGRFVAFAVAGVPARVMGIGPIAAVPKVMAMTGLDIRDMDVIELNEAFASQAIVCIRELGFDEALVNPWGGAIALGHPLGATGAVLTCKALDYLQKTGGKYGLVTMCIGNGMGAAGIFENLRR